MKKSFTLIEILIIAAILGFLSFIILSSFTNSLKSGRDSKRKTDLNNIATALELFYEDKGRYPLISEFYLSDKLCDSSSCARVYMNKIPKDPLTEKNYIYVTDENGTYFRIYSSIENESDNSEKGNKNSYGGSCEPSPCKYGVSSTNTSLIVIAADSQATLNSNLSLPVFSNITMASNSNLEALVYVYKGMSSNLYYPQLKYQTLTAACPNGYGVRDIQAKNNDNSRKDVRFMGCTPNETSPNNFGAACAFAADSPFSGEINMVCDKKYFRLPYFIGNVIAMSQLNRLPPIFNLGNPSSTTTTVNSQQQKVSVTCPTGFKATNITCNTHFVNYTYSSYINKYHIEKLESSANDSVSTASCIYKASAPFPQTYINTTCEKM